MNRVDYLKTKCFAESSIADEVWAIVDRYEAALKSAHEYACSCCDSSDSVKEHCEKALNGPSEPKADG